VIIPPYLFNAGNIVDVLTLAFCVAAFVMHLWVMRNIGSISVAEHNNEAFVDVFTISETKNLFVRSRGCHAARWLAVAR